MFVRRNAPAGCRRRLVVEPSNNPDSTLLPADEDDSVSRVTVECTQTRVSNEEVPTSNGSTDDAPTMTQQAHGRKQKLRSEFRTNSALKKVRVVEMLNYGSNRQLNLRDDARSTAVFDADTDKSVDHRSILERNAKIGEMLEKGELEEGVYRGKGAYRAYVKRSEGALSNAKSTGLYGPVRGTNNVRMTMYVDYNPEICKDYKETGYCGYGDSCKFLHDRSDYKGGWQVEQEWQAAVKRRQEKLRCIAEKHPKEADSDHDSSSSDENSEDDDGLPFACLKCRRGWVEDMNPVVTRCRHYFCEKCAFSHYSQSIKCFQCGTDTHGIFNTAQRILDKIGRRTNPAVETAVDDVDREGGLKLTQSSSNEDP